MTADQIQSTIDKILSALSQPTDIIEYTVGDKTVKKSRDELRKDLSFWRSELLKLNGIKRKVLVRM